VTGPKIAGPPPMIWKEGVGLVPADRQIAEGQRVEFAASVTPAVENLRYQWTVSPEGCSISAPASKETGVTCSKTGAYTMTCSVKSADGADLGSGTGSLSVTISQSDVSSGKKKDEAKKKLDNAKQLWSQKKYDEAIAAAEDAAKTDPKLAAPVLNQFSQDCKKMGWDALNKADHKEAIKRLEQAVKLNPADADAKKKLEEAKKYADVWPRVEAKAKEFDAFIAQKKVWSAQKAMLEMQDILRGQAGGQASTNPVWARVQADFNKGLAWYNDFSQKSNAEWTRLFKAEDWEKAEVHVKQVLTNELSPADKKHYEAALGTINTMLATKREAMQYYETAKANFARGVPADANAIGAVVKELKNKAARFKADDPRRAQINELAAAMEKKQKTGNAKAYAQSFFNTGDQYYRSYNFEAAAASYEQGLKAIRDNGDTKDPDYAKYSKLREDAALKDKRFKELYTYVAGLATTTSPLDEATIKKGVASAEEGLKVRPRNGDMEIHWNKLKWKLGELQQAKAKKEDTDRKCEAKWTEGQALYNAGKHADALAKFKENMACAPGNKQREAYVKQLDDSVKKQAAAKQACLALRQQGDAFAQQKKYGDAITKYRESLKCQPDPKLEAYIGQLEAEMKKQGDAQAAAIRAKQLRAEGELLQKQNKVPEAVMKYKEYLKYAPNDTTMANYIKTLEAKYAADQKNSQQAMQLRAQGEQLQKQNKIPEAIAAYKEYLRYAPNDTAMANHVKQLEASYAVKPVQTPSQGPVAAVSWTGSWKSSAGPEGEVISFNLTSSGTRITGNFSVVVPYKAASGARQTETLGGPLEGTVAGNTAKGTFRETSDAKNTGTFSFVMDQGGNRFTCTVRATETGDSRTYAVQRTR
jgi:tetratricopeptide (TPR) repeat protein